MDLRPCPEKCQHPDKDCQFYQESYFVLLRICMFLLLLGCTFCFGSCLGVLLFFARTLYFFLVPNGQIPGIFQFDARSTGPPPNEKIPGISQLGATSESKFRFPLFAKIIDLKINLYQSKHSQDFFLLVEVHLTLHQTGYFRNKGPFS